MPFLVGNVLNHRIALLARMGEHAISVLPVEMSAHKALLIQPFGVVRFDDLHYLRGGLCRLLLIKYMNVISPAANRK